MVEIERNVLLAERTTLGVGGPARALARCADVADLADALAWARQRDLEVFPLGGGSNVLVADAGFDGLVVRIEDASIRVEPSTDAAVADVRVGAGVDWDDLVARAVDEGWAGVECLSGIPGRVGAAPIQNIGAYCQEVAEVLAEVEVFDLHELRAERLDAADCGFAYRWSRFKGDWRGRYVVLAVHFRLRRGDLGAVGYPDLERRLGPGPHRLTEVRDAVLDVRRSKSMVLDPSDPNRRSAGSFFLNPIVAEETVDAVRARLRRSSRGDLADAMPAWTLEDGRVKLSAAWLIDKAAGLERGFRLGRAAISSRHSLALVNLGGATAREIVALAAHVRRCVREATGIVLQPEPIFLGFGRDVDELLAEC